jgi:hypothetical protein
MRKNQVGVVTMCGHRGQGKVVGGRGQELGLANKRNLGSLNVCCAAVLCCAALRNAKFSALLTYVVGQSLLRRGRFAGTHQTRPRAVDYRDDG